MNREKRIRLRLLREELHRTTGGKCFWCKRATVLCGRRDHLPPDAATLDHIVTRTSGGRYERENLVLACFKCNNTRGDMTATAFARKLADDAWMREFLGS